MTDVIQIFDRLDAIIASLIVLSYAIRSVVQAFRARRIVDLVEDKHGGKPGSVKKKIAVDAFMVSHPTLRPLTRHSAGKKIDAAVRRRNSAAR